MKHSKSHYLNMAHDGFKWGGYWNGHHHFIKTINASCFHQISVKESDIEDESWKYMCDKGLSRIVK